MASAARWLNWLPRLGLIGWLLLLLSAAGHKFGIFTTPLALALFAGGLVLCLLLVLSSLVIAVLGWLAAKSGWPRWGGIGLLVASLPLLVMVLVVAPGLGAPPIHDISTDLDNPPAITVERGPGANPTAHGGAEVAALQRQHYPQIQPVVVGVDLAQAMNAARQQAERLGWQQIELDGNARRLTAVAETALFGFQDDVVVRFTPVAEGTRVDVRSQSRVGQGDLGANARRVEAFLTGLQQALGEAQS